MDWDNQFWINCILLKINENWMYLREKWSYIYRRIIKNHQTSKIGPVWGLNKDYTNGQKYGKYISWFMSML